MGGWISGWVGAWVGRKRKRKGGGERTYHHPAHIDALAVLYPPHGAKVVRGPISVPLEDFEEVAHDDRRVFAWHRWVGRWVGG